MLNFGEIADRIACECEWLSSICWPQSHKASTDNSMQSVYLFEFYDINKAHKIDFYGYMETMYKIPQPYAQNIAFMHQYVCVFPELLQIQFESLSFYFFSSM